MGEETPGATAAAVACSFGALLRGHREAAGLTQEALAERAGVSARAVSALERGVNRAPRLGTLALLAAALGLAPQPRAALQAAARGAAPGRAGRPTDLPRPLTSFVGREREVAEVARRLGTARLLTLTGPGGVGKTRLAVEAAAGRAGDFADGVAFAALAPLADPAHVAAAAAAALGVPGLVGRSPEEVLVEHLRARALLLVLDNCEHVLAGVAPLVAELLAACPAVTVLATSREVLRVTGEHVLEVPPLALPDREAPATPESLGRAAAVRLFCERAAAGGAAFALTAENAGAVAAVCRRLDGLPLALELAAARVRLLPPAALLPRLERRLPLLTGGPRDAPARQRTLRDAIAWSYDLLPPAERALLRAAAVFAGGGTVAALEAVAGGREGDALAGLASLVDKSLLRPEVAAGQPRLGMLETIREFALEQLEASGEAAGVRRRHAAYYLALAPADRPQPPLADRNVLEGLDRLEADLGNYRDALAWFLAHGAGERALRLALALFPIWEDGGRLREGAWWLERALAASGRAPAALRAEGARCLALLITPQGDYDRAARLRRRALGLYRALGDAAGVAAVLMAQGMTARSRTDYAEARRCFAESLTLLTRLGHAAEGARCRAWLGAVARCEGRYAQARAYLEASLATSRRLARGADAAGAAAGEVAPFRCLEIEIWAAWNLGAVACDVGDYGAARGHWRAVLTGLPAGEPYSASSTLMQVARLAAGTGRPERAARLLAAADAQRAVSGHLWPAVDHADRDPLLAALRAALPAPALQAAWMAGGAMPLAAAVAVALDTLGPPAPAGAGDPPPPPLQFGRRAPAPAGRAGRGTPRGRSWGP